MAKAVYTTKNIGHYGLGFRFYTHFTSPIRRYPDVLVHRLLQHYLDKGKPVNAEELEEKLVIHAWYVLCSFNKDGFDVQEGGD